MNTPGILKRNRQRKTDVGIHVVQDKNMSISVSKNIFSEQEDDDNRCANCLAKLGGARKRCTKIKVIPRGVPSSSLDFRYLDVIEVLTEVYGISWSHIANEFNRASAEYEDIEKVLSYANGSLEMAVCDQCLPRLAAIHNVFKSFESKSKPGSIIKRVVEINKSVVENCSIIEQSVNADESNTSFSEIVKEQCKIEDDEQTSPNDQMEEQEYKVEIKCEVDPFQVYNLESDASGQMVESTEERESNWQQNTVTAESESTLTDEDQVTLGQLPISFMQPNFKNQEMESNWQQNVNITENDSEGQIPRNLRTTGRKQVVKPRTDYSVTNEALSEDEETSPDIGDNESIFLQEEDEMSDNCETEPNSSHCDFYNVPVATTSHEGAVEKLDSESIQNQKGVAKGLVYEALKLKGTSQEGIQEVLSSLSESTWKQYNSALRKWQQFCWLTDYEVLKPCSKSLLAFLEYINEQGTHFSTINTTQAAVSFLSMHALGHSLGECLDIKKFRKKLLRPTGAPRTVSWDPTPVLNYLSSLEPIESLSMSDLSLKTFGLFSLATGHRMSVLADIKARTLKILNTGIKIPLIVTETNRTGPRLTQKYIILPLLPNSPTICPARCLKEYLQKTEPHRCDSHNLFISFQNPFQDVKACTLHRWQKIIIANSGLDNSKFLPGCLKYASPVVLTQRGIPVKKIRAKNA